MIALAAAAAEPRCNGVPIRSMIKNYAGMIQRQDSAAIAHLFGTDGVIENPGSAPITGEAAILAFLGGFKDAAVKSEVLTVEGLVPAGADWRVTGRFHQTGRSPDGKDYDVAGSFYSTWTCSADGWRVRRVATGK